MLDSYNKTWLLNTRNHYKIWFSRNTNEFLSVENKIRCIRFKLDNPDSALHLVYSSAILSSTAKTDLSDFCKKIGIQALDFDQEIPALFSQPYDSILYALAKDEIKHALEDRGGNLAAASDCTRLITGVIKRCGIYSDFDVEIQFKDVPPILSILAPVLLPIVVKVQNDELQNLCYNNEFIAFAHNPSKPNELTPEGLAGLHHIQQQLIIRYARPLEALSAPIIKGLHTGILMNPEAYAVLKHLEHKNGTKQNVFSVRQTFESLTVKDLILSAFASEKDAIVGASTPTIDELSENALTEALGQHLLRIGMTLSPKKTEGLTSVAIAQRVLNLMQAMLYKASVTHISGPYLALAFFLDTIENFDFFKIVMEPQSLERDVFIHCLQRASLKENGLQKVVIGQDRKPKDNELLNDESWTKKGAESATKRSDVYLKAILTLQRTIRSRSKRLEKTETNKANKDNPNLRPLQFKAF